MIWDSPQSGSCILEQLLLFILEGRYSGINLTNLRKYTIPCRGATKVCVQGSVGPPKTRGKGGGRGFPSPPGAKPSTCILELLFILEGRYSGTLFPEPNIGVRPKSNQNLYSGSCILEQLLLFILDMPNWLLPETPIPLIKVVYSGIIWISTAFGHSSRGGVRFPAHSKAIPCNLECPAFWKPYSGTTAPFYSGRKVFWNALP